MKRWLFVVIVLFYCQDIYGQTGLPQPHEPCGPEEEVLRYLEFSLDHSQEHKQPYWVAYTLESEELNFSRAFGYSPFKEDPNLSSQGSAISDYRNSGYDRGHLTRASYNKRSEKTLREAYYLSGISPQIGVKFNRFRGAWYRIEKFEVELAQTYGRVYGVSGPIFQNNIETIGEGEITVPGYFYKVVLFLDESELWQAVGFLTSHSEDIQTPVEEFIKPIDEIEQLSGIDFNCVLPDSIQSRIEINSFSFEEH